MSTRAVKADRAVTDQVRRTPAEAFKAAAEALIPWGVSTAQAGSWALTDAIQSRAAVYQVSEKAAEAQRQITRIKSLTAFCPTPQENDEHQQRLESIESSISLIGSFLTSPIPIPVASSGADYGATLFFDGDEFYGDLEIKGNSVEYYLKSVRGGQETEVFDTENIRDGFIPPRLLTCLFSHYTR